MPAPANDVAERVVSCVGLWPGCGSQVGFRQTSVSEGRLLHNGAPVMMRGVNRHEWDHRTGKVISEEHMLRWGAWGARHSGSRLWGVCAVGGRRLR